MLAEKQEKYTRCFHGMQRAMTGNFFKFAKHLKDFVSHKRTFFKNNNPIARQWRINRCVPDEIEAENWLLRIWQEQLVSSCKEGANQRQSHFWFTRQFAERMSSSWAKTHLVMSNIQWRRKGGAKGAKAPPTLHQRGQSPSK